MLFTFLTLIPIEAKAWRLFGREVGTEHVLLDHDCPEGCSAIYREWDNYILGIRVGGGSEVECVCP